MPYEHILVDDPRPRVRRITLNRPEKRNALNNRLRAEVFEVLEAGRSRSRSVDLDRARRRSLLFRGLRSFGG